MRLDKYGYPACDLKLLYMLTVNAHLNVSLANEYLRPPRDFKKHVIGLVSAKIPEKGVVGFHGTSLHAVKELLFTGNLPSSVGASLRGELYFCPKPSTLRTNTWECLIPPHDAEALAEATSYAKLIGSRHYLMASLGLDKTDGDAQEAAARLCFDSISKKELKAPLYRSVRDLSLSEPALREAIDRARKIPAGVLIAFGPRIYTDFQVVEAVKGDQGFRVLAPHGISATCIKAIVPLGNFERGYFGSLDGNNAK